jgi:LytS/YehU family sensor histidine kinase
LHQEKLVLEQKMLRTQMNPHFVFNALTAIQKTIFDHDPLKSSAYLSRFAKLIRQNFEFVNKKLITLEEDLDALKNYIETQQLRFENKFDYEIHVGEGIETSFVKIPPMLLQPFIENSIEHGIKPKKEKGYLQINITHEGAFTRIEVIDDGVGYHKEKIKDDREHAIDIFLKRLKLRNLGEEKLFSIQALENGSGTKVTILLNLAQ